METLTNIAAVALTAIYGIAGAAIVAHQDRIGLVILMAVVNLAIGFVLYPFLEAIASVVAWIIATGIVLWLVGVLFG